MGSVLMIVIIIVAVIFRSWRKVWQGSQTKGTADDPVRMGSRTAETGEDVFRGKTVRESSRRGRLHDTSRKSSGKSGSAFYVKPDQKENILNAARENTVEAVWENDMDAMASEKLMADVYDLIIKGPKDSLDFSRDFVSEGTDMLNRYTTLMDTDLLQ